MHLFQPSSSPLLTTFPIPSTMTSTPITDAPCATNHLRCLIVDDNTLNLAILSMMLKRRFSHVLDGPPIAVDGGLKAIQALRQEGESSLPSLFMIYRCLTRFCAFAQYSTAFS